MAEDVAEREKSPNPSTKVDRALEKRAGRIERRINYMHEEYPASFFSKIVSAGSDYALERPKNVVGLERLKGKVEPYEELLDIVGYKRREGEEIKEFKGLLLMETLANLIHTEPKHKQSEAWRDAFKSLDRKKAFTNFISEKFTQEEFDTEYDTAQHRLVNYIANEVRGTISDNKEKRMDEFLQRIAKESGIDSSSTKAANNALRVRRRKVSESLLNSAEVDAGLKIISLGSLLVSAVAPEIGVPIYLRTKVGQAARAIERRRRSQGKK